MITRTRVLIAITATALAIAPLAACSTSDSTSKVVATSGVPDNGGEPAADAARIGATLEIVDGDNKAQVTIADLAPTTPSQFASPSGELYSIDITVQALEGKVNVNPLYFTAKTADGTTLTADLIGVDDQITVTELPAGQKVRGLVAFDVPVGKPITQIVFTGPLGEQLGIWNV